MPQISKIQKANTFIDGASSKNQIVSEDRTFFCSELVAKAMKVLGALEDDGTSCSQFYPSHFTTKDDGALPLAKGVSIG